MKEKTTRKAICDRKRTVLLNNIVKCRTYVQLNGAASVTSAWKQEKKEQHQKLAENSRISSM